jgi:glycerol-3-phosphate dehydrogenase
MKSKRVAVLGGGINGLMTAWALLDQGYAVCLFEAKRLMGATSRASSKMLHGGLRYLEQGHFSLVREALLERRWWLDQHTGLAEPFRMIIPGYRGKGRHPLLIRTGTMLYDLLATGSRLPWSSYLSASRTLVAVPGLKTSELIGSVSYWDVRMDDEQLGLWVSHQLKDRGLEVREHTEVQRINEMGEVFWEGGEERFDAIANVTGPWAIDLLDASAIKCAYRLVAVRGSHLVIDRPLEIGCLFQQDDGRVVFYLPYGDGQALLGTTEVEVSTTEPVKASQAEIDELIAIHGKYIDPPIKDTEILDVYAGLRPIVLPRFATNRDTKAMSRESMTVRHGKVVTLLGGKWTTSRKQGQAVAALVKSTLV